MHLPNIYIDDSCNLDCRVLAIKDISIYDPDVAITNAVIKINIPNDPCDYLPPFAVKGKSYYTTNTFKITDASCGQGLASLPDGVYKITYSVCPNEELFVNLIFLRDCQTRCVVLNQLSNIIKGGDCDIIFDGYGNNITVQRIQELRDLLTILDTAKVEAKSGKYSQAEDKLHYVNKRLNTFIKH